MSREDNALPLCSSDVPGSEIFGGLGEALERRWGEQSINHRLETHEASCKRLAVSLC